MAAGAGPAGRPPARQTVPHPLAALALVAVAALALAACSSSGSATGGGSAVVGAQPAPVGTPRGAVGTATSGADSGAGVGAPAASGPVTQGAPTKVQGADLLTGRSVVRTAALAVRVHDVLVASTRAGALAVSLGGFVAGEQTQAQPDQPATAEAVLTLRVPATQLPALVSALHGLGTLVSEQQSADDVTGQVIDVQARIAAQRASVARVSALMARANTLGEVVQIEGELTRRQADLESLEGQAAKLADQTSLGTVVVTLAGQSVTPAPKPGPPAPTGFGAGLSRGWHGFVTAGTWVLTAVGTAVPFLLLAVPTLALVLLVRRRRPGEPAPAGPPVPPAATA